MKQKSTNLSLVALAAILLVVIVGEGFYIWQENLPKRKAVDNAFIEKPVTDAIFESVEPISYSLSGVSAQVMTSVGSFDYTADQLELTAKNCDYQIEPGYFNNLVTKLSGAKKITYNFNYTGATYIDLNQGPNAFTVTLIENKIGYPSLNEFIDDFNICGAGGDAYPVMLNSKWLLFINSCSDASGPTGCDLAREVVEPTLSLK